MANGEQKVYMPLMMGDWIKGTRGMRAEVKGVYIGLLIHQYDHGYLPADVDDLSLIEPEVNKVWHKLKEKFEEFEPGKLRNKKLEDVRAFWKKQKSNGKQGGRPKKPKLNPNSNPNDIPNHNHHNDIDIDSDSEVVYELKEKEPGKKFERPIVLPPEKSQLIEAIMTDELYMAEVMRLHRGKDIRRAFDECYIHHSNAPNPPQETSEWKQKLNTWLINTKNGSSKKADGVNARREGFAKRHSSDSGG